MRAPEEQRVDLGVPDRSEQAFGQHVDLVRVGLAPLDELDETRARRARQVDRGVGIEAATTRWYAPEAMVPTVPITPTRPVTVARTAGPQPGLDHARPHGDRPSSSRPGGGGGVARHHDHLDVVLVDQLGRDLPGEAAYLVEAAGARTGSGPCRRCRRGSPPAAGR